MEQLLDDLHSSMTQHTVGVTLPTKPLWEIVEHQCDQCGDFIYSASEAYQIRFDNGEQVEVCDICYGNMQEALHD